jgi:hypothetical protein
MALFPYRIFRIQDAVASINDGQICIEDGNDSDLGFRMFGYKDGNGVTQKCLAKNQDAYIQDLRLNGSTTIGETGLLKHDTNGDVTGGKLSIAELEDLLTESLPTGGVTGLSEDQILIGSATGLIEQTNSFKFDDTDLLIRYDPSTDPAKYMGINWRQVYGGDTVTVGGSVEAVVALGVNLSLTGDMTKSIALGSGTVDANRSVIAGDALNIGQGSGTNDPTGDSILCLGTSIDADAGFASLIGNVIDVNEAFFVSALGDNLAINHDYCTSRGKHVSTIWEGARHFGMDRYDSDPGSAMGIDGLVLVGEQSGGGTCILHTTFADATAYSFSIPDSRAVLIEFDVMTSSVGTNDTKNGLYAISGTATLWRNGGFFGWSNPTPNVIVNRTSYDGDSWTTSVSFTHNPADPSGAVRIMMTVTGTCTTDLIHELIIKSAIVMRTAYYHSS